MYLVATLGERSVCLNVNRNSALRVVSCTAVKSKRSALSSVCIIPVSIIILHSSVYVKGLTNTNPRLIIAVGCFQIVCGKRNVNALALTENVVSNSKA